MLSITIGMAILGKYCFPNRISRLTKTSLLKPATIKIRLRYYGLNAPYISIPPMSVISVAQLRTTISASPPPLNDSPNIEIRASWGKMIAYDIVQVRTPVINIMSFVLVAIICIVISLKAYFERYLKCVFH